MLVRMSLTKDFPYFYRDSCFLTLSGKWYNNISSYMRSIERVRIMKRISKLPFNYSPLSLCFSNSNSSGLILSLIGSSDSMWSPARYSCSRASVTVILFLGSKVRSLYKRSMAWGFESGKTFLNDLAFLFLHFLTNSLHYSFSISAISSFVGVPIR